MRTLHCSQTDLGAKIPARVFHVGTQQTFLSGSIHFVVSVDQPWGDRGSVKSGHYAEEFALYRGFGQQRKLVQQSDWRKREFFEVGRIEAAPRRNRFR